jgi:uncharacterized membrane protein YqjE
MSGDPGEPRPEGSVRNIGTTLLALLGTRIELIGVELREESLRIQRMLVAGAVAAILLGAALVLAGVLVVVAFWDTHRLLALAAVTVAYAALGAVLLARARAAARAAPTPFAATAAEIQADLELLRDPPPKAP